jgi:hypothetical protein
VSANSGHVSSDRLGEVARHGGLDTLRDSEQRHVQSCDRCQHLYGGYRLADRLLCAEWREVKLPVTALARPSRVAAFRDALAGLNARALAPELAALAVVALIGAALVAPRLIPAAPAGTRSPSVGSASPWTSPSSPATAGTPSASTGSQTPGAAASPPASASAAAPDSAMPQTLALVRFGGSPIAWSPDGAHLLVWGANHILQIREASGRLTGSIAADSATWVSSTTIAIAAHTTGSSGSASPSPTGSPTPGDSPSSSPAPDKSLTPSIRPSGHHPSPEAASSEPGPSRPEKVYLIDLGAHVAATLPGGYPVWIGLSNAMLLGSGRGQVAIATPGDPGSAWQYVLWDGSLRAVADGLPIAFTQDGARLAVLHPTASGNGYATGWLEIVSVPSLARVASFPHLSVKVAGGSLGSAYGIDAAFSPNGRYLLASGTLVSLSNGSALGTGRGGWLPDGTLVTASNAGLLRWTGTVSNPDPRFSGPGMVGVARDGELVYVFSDGRPALLLDAAGTVHALSMPGVRAISYLLLSPDGRAIALDGRATDGSSITAVAQLP